MTKSTARWRSALLVAATAVLITVTGAACEPAPTKGGSTPTTTTPPTVATTAVPCAAGGSITVATSLAPQLRELLAAAKRSNLDLCGGGYRDNSRQIELRKQNCGTTQYDIWEKPSSRCNPPTAIPGTSMHEKGLAIDFNSCSTRTTACFKWLERNASKYGLKNLPSEPWHWSTTGRSKAGDHAHDDHDV